MFWENPTFIWIVIAAILFGAEMLTGTFYLLVLGIAAAVGTIAAWAGAPFWTQVGAATAVAAVGAFLVSRWHKKHDRKQKQSDNNMEIGQTVIWLGTNSDGTWQVRYRGSQWQAEPIRPEVDSARTLIIVETRGNLLIVDNKLDS